MNDRSPPAAACAAVPCLCAEVPEETGQCWFGETALWSHCYSCLCLSTCAEEPGHQSLGEGAWGLEKGRHKIRWLILKATTFVAKIRPCVICWCTRLFGTELIGTLIQLWQTRGETWERHPGTKSRRDLHKPVCDWDLNLQGLDAACPSGPGRRSSSSSEACPLLLRLFLLFQTYAAHTAFTSQSNECILHICVFWFVFPATKHI